MNYLSKEEIDSYNELINHKESLNTFTPFLIQNAHFMGVL